MKPSILMTYFPFRLDNTILVGLIWCHFSPRGKIFYLHLGRDKRFFEVG